MGSVRDKQEACQVLEMAVFRRSTQIFRQKTPLMREMEENES